MGRPHGLAHVITRAAAAGAVAALVLAGCGSAADPGDGGASGSAAAFDGDLSGTQPAGTVIATSGFDISTNGFRFENYGKETQTRNLDAPAMNALFGDQVCSRKTPEGECKLTPTATTWMNSMNDAMGGGHCFGLAGLSWAMYKGQVPPAKYGGAVAGDLNLSDNPQLQSDIATIFATQATAPTTDAMREFAPNEALAELAAAWQRGDGFALGFANLVDGEEVDGHAVTPVALESLGDGQVGIVLYDNIYPDEPRTMVVDVESNTWSYSTSADPEADPEEYTGGTDNLLELWQVAPMLGPQQCPFCAGGSASVAVGLNGEERTVTGGSEFTYVYLNQSSEAKGVAINVTDMAGNPITGAVAHAPMSGAQGAPSTLLVPKDVPFKVRIDGSGLKEPTEADLTIIGSGTSFSVDEVTIDPGVVDTVVFDPSTETVEYQTSTGAAPDVTVTVDGDEASYAFTFGGLDLPAAGGAIKVRLDSDAQTVTASATGAGTSQIDFVIERSDDESEDILESEPIELEPGQALIVQYGAWEGGGAPVPVGIDTEGSGEITEQLVESK